MEKLNLTDFYNYKFISRLTYSPNKENVACTVTTIDDKDNSYKNNIYTFKNGEFDRLTGLDKESSFKYLDDKTLLFPTMRDKADLKKAEEGYPLTCFYKLSLDGGEAQKAFSVPLRVTSYHVLNEDTLVLTAVFDVAHPNYFEYNDEKKAALLKEKKDNADYEVIDEIPWWTNGGTFTNKNRVGLYLYDIPTSKITKLTGKTFNMGWTLTVDQEGQRVFFTGSDFKTKPQRIAHLHVYDHKTKEVTTLINSKQFKSISDVQLFNGKLLLAAATGKNYGMNENASFYTYDFDSKEVTLFKEYGEALGSSVGSDCRYGGGEQTLMMNDKYYFVSTIKNASHLYSLDFAGNIEEVIDYEGSVDCIDMSTDSVVYVGMKEGKLQEVYQYDLKNGNHTQLSNFNEDVLRNKYVAAYNKITIQSNGDDIDGWVLLPKDYDASKKYPAILDIHGGPKTVYGEVFYHEMQLWANEGYFVMFCNPHGSDGKGDAFADIRGKYGTIDYDDIMSFVDAVIAKYPAIDEKKIGVTGGSYGGFMTNWIVGHTKRFAAAATQRSISNWMSMYGTCDIGFYFAPDQMAADPFTEEGQAKMWWHSPLKYAKNVKTPTLFIHSNEDYRCWIPEGMQFFTALTDRGVKTRMCYFKGENHELSRSGKPLHRTRRLTEITNWMNEHCK